MANIHNQDNVTVSNQANTQTINGDVHFHPFVPSSASDYDQGVRLGQAPQIDSDLFIGREDELEQLRVLLAPQDGKQNIVAICGMGGMGKTQLSIRFTLTAGQQYSAVYWMDAKDESLLRSVIASLARDVNENTAATSTDNLQEEEALTKYAKQWLSHKENDRWLIVYDNYDDPRLPGWNSTTGYDIRSYFPFRSHGSILITTRSPRLSFAKQLPLRKFNDISQSLSILGTRSGRDVGNDNAPAIQLAQRLDGLPLALATAGAYLNQSADSFEDYLNLYNNNWHDLRHDNDGPVDYEERTLYTTWNISYQVVQEQNPSAAELLQLLAYFDNQDLWYELFNAGSNLEGAPQWWASSHDRVKFNRAMATLYNYSLIDVTEGQYSLHSCVHDWTLECLNRELDKESFSIAIYCIAQSIRFEHEVDYWTRNRRLFPHMVRLQLQQFRFLFKKHVINPGNLLRLAWFYKLFEMYSEAEQLYTEVLLGAEQAQGADQELILEAVHELGSLCTTQGKLVEAERMLQRALVGREQLFGPHDVRTLGTINELGMLCCEQGKMIEAEQLLYRALVGREQVCGSNHVSTLYTVNNLSILYSKLGKLPEAERMYLRALVDKEQAFGIHHVSTLRTVYNLGVVYHEEGRWEEAEQMYLRALVGLEQSLGANNTLTLQTVHSLGNLYHDQGRLVDAEQMFLRALNGKEQVLGMTHELTHRMANILIDFYNKQNRMAESHELAERYRIYEPNLGK